MDALALPPYGGARSAVINRLKALAHYHGEASFIVLLSHGEPECRRLPNIEQVIIPVSGRFLTRLQLHAALPSLILRHKPDIVHFMRNLGAPVSRAKTVLHLHDLTRFRYPTMFSAWDVWYWKLIQPRMLKRMDRIVCISEATRRDLLQWLNYPDRQTRTVYEFAGKEFQPTDKLSSFQLLAAYGITEPFVLYVGGLAEHKNVRTLVHAFAALKQIGSFPHKLVIVGGQFHTNNDVSLRSLASQLLGADVIFTGAVPNQVLRACYCATELFAFPSLYEGFGLAPLEAMACGAPVIAAKTGALPEALGEAAIWIDDATDTEQWSREMNRVLNDPGLQTALREKALKQAARFSAERTSSSIFDVYRELVSG